MQIVRRSSFTPAPWKNGGGITYEALRFPATGVAFRWRVSVAQIDQSGPFSDFAEYHRKMVLLRGAGLRLTFDDGGETYLRATGDLAEFDGARHTECALLEGACTDLNLMVAKSLKGVHASVERLAQPRLLEPSPHTTTLVFAISGLVTLGFEGHDSARLLAWDLAVLHPNDRGRIGPAAPDESVAPLVFLATLEDN